MLFYKFKFILNYSNLTVFQNLNSFKLFFKNSFQNFLIKIFVFLKVNKILKFNGHSKFKSHQTYFSLPHSLTSMPLILHLPNVHLIIALISHFSFTNFFMSLHIMTCKLHFLNFYGSAMSFGV